MTALYNGLPVFEVSLGENTDFEAVSIVTEPAIQKYFLAMSAEEDTHIQFSNIDDDKHIVTGPVLLPEQMIFRRTEDGQGFYVKFSAEMIEKFAINFFAQHSNTTGNVEHEVFVDGITYFESYLINKERGLCPNDYSDLPDGTWCMSAKITNEDVWRLIKNGTLKGFSIQINHAKIDKVEEKIDTIEELMSYLKNH